jgi:hypothetical protein
MTSTPPSGRPGPEHPSTRPDGTDAGDVAHEADVVETVVDDVAAPEDGPARGVRALAGEQFSVAEAVGGVRGLVESVAPGLVFVVLYVATSDLTWALVGSVAVALVAVGVRLAQRTPVTQALGGLLGVGIGVFWAWRSGEAQDYFAWGLWTNAAYLLALLVSLAIRWPLVGLVVEGFRSGFGTGAARSADAVQVPLYLDGSVGWLGTARLVMGIPLWALVLWLTWVLVRRPAAGRPA